MTEGCFAANGQLFLDLSFTFLSQIEDHGILYNEQSKF